MYSIDFKQFPIIIIIIISIILIVLLLILIKGIIKKWKQKPKSVENLRSTISKSSSIRQKKSTLDLKDGFLDISDSIRNANEKSLRALNQISDLIYKLVNSIDFFVNKFRSDNRIIEKISHNLTSLENSVAQNTLRYQKIQSVINKHESKLNSLIELIEKNQEIEEHDEKDDEMNSLEWLLKIKDISECENFSVIQAIIKLILKVDIKLIEDYEMTIKRLTLLLCTYLPLEVKKINNKGEREELGASIENWYKNLNTPFYLIMPLKGKGYDRKNHIDVDNDGNIGFQIIFEVIRWGFVRKDSEKVLEKAIVNIK